MSKNSWNLLKETIQIVFFAMILTVVLRSYIVEAREIPSESMVPTLQIGDRLLVNKFIYKLENLHRKDIVVFAPPAKAQALIDVQHKHDDLIKRVIGLPGDKIQIAEGTVFVNDKPLTEPYIASKPDYTFGPVVVPKDSVFVLGDNRNNSLDSHYWGFLPINNIKGKAFVKYWPPNRLSVIDEK